MNCKRVEKAGSLKLRQQQREIYISFLFSSLNLDNRKKCGKLKFLNLADKYTVNWQKKLFKCEHILYFVALQKRLMQLVEFCVLLPRFAIILKVQVTFIQE